MRWRIALVGLACAGILAGLLVALWGYGVNSTTATPLDEHAADAIWAAHLAEAGRKDGELEITYPFDGAVFPPEIVEPNLRWQDKQPEADAWLLAIEFADGKEPVKALTEGPKWTPSPEQWQDIKARSVASPAKVTVLGVNRAAPGKLLSSATIRIQTSKDEVGAPLFYREVPLPFSETVNYFSRIRWRFGAISSRTQPPIVLDDMPVCANCHSFSTDGKEFAMDVDYANDKGSYVMSPIEEEMVLDPGKIITWADYKKEDQQPTFGLLSQVSPDGRHAVSTVKDRSVFVPLDNLEFATVLPDQRDPGDLRPRIEDLHVAAGGKRPAIRPEQPLVEPRRKVHRLCPQPGLQVEAHYGRGADRSHPGRVRGVHQGRQEVPFRSLPRAL